MNQTSCVACSSNETELFYSASGIPVDIGNLASSCHRAKQAICGDMNLVSCRQCGTVHNRSFDSSLIGFKPGYDASLIHSPLAMQAQERTIAKLLVDYCLDGRKVLEIGCGRGHFLRSLCENTRLSAVGIDPSADEVIEVIGDSQMRLLRDRFSEQHRELLGDLIVSISVIEAIPQPLEFLRTLRSLIGTRNVAVYFELFHGLEAITSGNVWSPHYEQCSYFGENSIGHLFRHAGFHVLNVDRAPGNPQYLCVQADTSTPNEPIPQPNPSDHSFSEFSALAKRKIANWQNRFEAWQRQAKRVFVWGTGGKAISFLSLIPGAESVRAVIDVNPNRQGLYTPKSAKKVLSPKQFAAEQPDVVVISNPAYRAEIELELQRLGVTCEVKVV